MSSLLAKAVMTEAERKSFIAYSSSRGPGKRQIKPNVAILNEVTALNDNDDDDDEDDDDFIEAAEDKQTSSSSSSDSSKSESDESSESEEGKESEDEEDNVSELDVPKSARPDEDRLICALCLNMRSSVKKEEVIQCDKCGLAVHENCYLVDTGDELESNHSSSSTEPWFCEPCLYGMKEPPHCELCPSRFGAFKKSDIGGGWVHLLCALYTPGITFGDVDHLTAVSWQELDYKLFDRRRKPCVACKEPVVARTGITVACDAALCNSHLHVTCAQKLGLLVDNSDRKGAAEHGKQENEGKQAWYTNDAEIVDPRYLTCKKHRGDEVRVAQCKAACVRFYKQEEERMRVWNRRILNEREENKRQRAVKRHRQTLKKLEGVTIAWPDHENKRPRLLHSSPRFLEAFAEKAFAEGISRHKFMRNFSKVNGALLTNLPPGFSTEFVSYYEARENTLLPAEVRAKQQLITEEADLRSKHKLLENEYRQEVDSFEKSHKEDQDSALLGRWADLLSRLGVKKIKKPIAASQTTARKLTQKARCARNSTSTPKAVVRRSITMKKNGRISDSVLMATPSSSMDTLKPSLQLNTCDTCHESTDQHLLTLCDTCHKYYHLACLDPPLTKMPKKTRIQGWQCSACGESSSDEDEKKAEQINSSNASSNSLDGVGRRLRDRTSMNEKKLSEEKEQKKAFRAAVRGERVPWAGNRRSSTKSIERDTPSKRNITSPLSICTSDTGGTDNKQASPPSEPLSPTRKRRRQSMHRPTVINGLTVEAVKAMRRTSEAVTSPTRSAIGLKKKAQRRLSCSTARSPTMSPNRPRQKLSDTALLNGDLQ